MKHREGDDLLKANPGSLIPNPFTPRQSQVPGVCHPHPRQSSLSHDPSRPGHTGRVRHIIYLKSYDSLIISFHDNRRVYTLRNNKRDDVRK